MKQDTIIGKELVIEFEGGEYEIDGSRSGCPTKVISIPPKNEVKIIEVAHPSGESL